MKYVNRILTEVSKSFFEKFDPVKTGEDWRDDAKRSFGKRLHNGTTEIRTPILVNAGERFHMGLNRLPEP